MQTRQTGLMMTDPASADTTEAVVSQLDKALDDHLDWLQRWHRSVVCGENPDKDIVAPDPHLETEFGRWLDGRDKSGVLAQPAFAELEVSFKDMHEFARMLILLHRQGKEIPVVEYDIFMERVNSFVGLLRRMQDAFRKAVSELDPLTGLHNRQIMLRELTTEYERSVRSGTPCAVILADLDHFKRVNDDYGHAAGDKVLSTVAGRFLSHLRPYDFIYRYGGEEFLILLPNTNTGTAISVLERLRHELADSAIVIDGDVKLAVTASFGLTMISGAFSLNETLEHADQALYQSKENGRNRVSIWNESKLDE